MIKDRIGNIIWQNKGSPEEVSKRVLRAVLEVSPKKKTENCQYNEWKDGHNAGWNAYRKELIKRIFAKDSY
jgi:hypothetical protein